MKVLIVDDEIISIRMLKNIISWEELGFQIIGYANDGEEAYNIVLNEKPDIIISDIRMNSMNGIELVKKVQSIYNDIKFILMSAYADFSYIKEAISLNCSDYILKPIDELELEQILKKVSNEIRGNQQKDKIVENSQKQLRLFELYKYMKFGNNINKILKNLNNFGINFENFIVLLIQQNKSSINEYTYVNNIELLQEKYIENIFNKIIRKIYCKNFINFSYENEYSILLVENSNINEVVKICEDIISEFLKELNIDILICFSCIGKKIQDTPILYGQVKSLSKYGFYIGNEKILGYNYNCNGEEIDEIKYISIIKEAEEALKSYDVNYLNEILNTAFELTMEFNPNTLKNIYEFCYRLLICINNILKIEDNSVKYENLQKYTSLKDLKEFMINYIQKLNKIDINKIKRKFSKPIEESLEIIEKNYDKNISLDELSKTIAISKNYFCYLFKREVGVSIWDYLTQVRLEHAKKLLRETDMRIYEIAFKVGYDNSSYFSKKFKEIELMTPNEYREKII